MTLLEWHVHYRLATSTRREMYIGSPGQVVSA